MYHQCVSIVSMLRLTFWLAVLPTVRLGLPHLHPGSQFEAGVTLPKHSDISNLFPGSNLAVEQSDFLRGQAYDVPNTFQLGDHSSYSFTNGDLGSSEFGGFGDYYQSLPHRLAPQSTHSASAESFCPGFQNSYFDPTMANSGVDYYVPIGQSQHSAPSVAPPFFPDSYDPNSSSNISPALHKHQSAGTLPYDPLVNLIAKSPMPFTHKMHQGSENSFPYASTEDLTSLQLLRDPSVSSELPRVSKKCLTSRTQADAVSNVSAENFRCTNGQLQQVLDDAEHVKYEYLAQQRKRKELLFSPREFNQHLELEPEKKHVAQDWGHDQGQRQILEKSAGLLCIKPLQKSFCVWLKGHRPETAAMRQDARYFQNIVQRLIGILDGYPLGFKLKRVDHDRLPICLLAYDDMHIIRPLDSKKKNAILGPRDIASRVTEVLVWLQFHHAAFIEELGEKAPFEAQRKLFEWLEMEIFQPNELPVFGLALGPISDPDVFKSSPIGWLQLNLISYLRHELSKTQLDNMLLEIIAAWYMNKQPYVWEEICQADETNFWAVAATALRKYYTKKGLKFHLHGMTRHTGVQLREGQKKTLRVTDEITKH